MEYEVKAVCAKCEVDKLQIEEPYTSDCHNDVKHYLLKELSKQLEPYIQYEECDNILDDKYTIIASVKLLVN